MAFHPLVEQMCQAAYQTTELMARASISKVGEIESNDSTNALFAAICAAGGALKTLSELISNQPEGDPTGNGGKETALIAALMVARIAIPNKEGVRIDFTPRNIIAAINAASKLTECDLNAFVNPYLLQTFQRFAAQQGATLGYWDDLPDIGPSFEGFDNVVNFTRH